MIEETQATRRDGRRGDAGDAVLENDRNPSRRRSRSEPIIAIAVAAATLFFGYGDLWNGGNTVSALLITVGYIIMVPIAIMVRPRRH